jgi:chromosome segregation ATPase
MEAAQEQGIDSLASLEERITRAVQAITTLRGENAQLHHGLKGTQDELQSANSARSELERQVADLHREKEDLLQKVSRLGEELDALRGERKQVRTRIEKLLSQLDLLSAS